MPERPKLVRITEEMKEWSALLDSELSSWPSVTRKPMFGMVAYYRDGAIFAAVPRTKSFEPTNSVGFKFYKLTPTLKSVLERDARIRRENSGMSTWITFAIRESRDLKQALEWLGRAYDGAKVKATLR